MKLFKILLVMLVIPVLGLGQTLKIGDDLTVVHFNAGWNSAADVSWFGKLKDGKLKRCDIATETEAQNKYEIVVVPTIIIFNEGEEVKRFQADISFAMKATREEVQGYIDEIIMNDF